MNRRAEDRGLRVEIEKAKTACESSGVTLSDHFADVGKMVDLGSGSKREIEDVALTYKNYNLNEK